MREVTGHVPRDVCPRLLAPAPRRQPPFQSVCVTVPMCMWQHVRAGNLAMRERELQRWEKESLWHSARGNDVAARTMRRRGLQAAKTISHITDLVFHLIWQLLRCELQRSHNWRAKLPFHCKAEDFTSRAPWTSRTLRGRKMRVANPGIPRSGCLLSHAVLHLRLLEVNMYRFLCALIPMHEFSLTSQSL